MARTRTQVRHTVSFSTSLHPAAAAALAALADREPDGHASGVISRLVRAELDRLAPGAWDAAMHRTAYGPPWTEEEKAIGCRVDDEVTPEKRAHAAAKVIRDALGRARWA